jgi:hypothetical protein
VTERLWRPIVGMDPWSLIWRRRRHRRAAAAQARRSSSACLASSSRGEATEATTKSRIVGWRHKPGVRCRLSRWRHKPGVRCRPALRWQQEGRQQGQQGNITRLQQGPIVVVAVAGWQRRQRMPGLLPACLVSRSRTRGAVGNRGQHACKTCAHSGKEIGAMAGSSRMVSHFSL